MALDGRVLGYAPQPFEWSNKPQTCGLPVHSLEYELARMQTGHYKTQKSYHGRRHATKTMAVLPERLPPTRKELGYRPGSYETAPEVLQLFEERGGAGPHTADRKIDLTRCYVKIQHQPWLRRASQRTPARDLDHGTAWSSRDPRSSSADRRSGSRDSRDSRDRERRRQRERARAEGRPQSAEPGQGMRPQARRDDRPGTAPARRSSSSGGRR